MNTRVDHEHPWPWLDAFTEADQGFFNGRRSDIEALERRVPAQPVTVLFGKSGLGKTSLLQAGLFPRLRAAGLLPVLVRLQHGPTAPPPLAAIHDRLMAELRACQLRLVVPAELQALADAPDSGLDSEDRLWLLLHARALQFKAIDPAGPVPAGAGLGMAGPDGASLRPVFVLDQFEELFTLGAHDTERQRRLFGRLGDLIENRIPAAIHRAIDADEDLLDHLDLGQQPYRVVLSLREDYLADLEIWSDLIPRLGPNRWRLEAMTAEQALDAVQLSGGALVSASSAGEIVDYLGDAARAGPGHQRGARSAARVEPALLSLLCAGLNQERLDAARPTLDAADLAVRGGRIIEAFYDRAFESLRSNAAALVEDTLITPDGVRLKYPLDSLVQAEGLQRSDIDQLINRRLLRKEALAEGEQVELVHDRVAEIARRRRGEREARAAQAEEHARRRSAEAEARLARIRLRRELTLRQWLIAAFVGTLIAMVWGWTEARLARQARARAQDELAVSTALTLAQEGRALVEGRAVGGATAGWQRMLAAVALAPERGGGQSALEASLRPAPRLRRIIQADQPARAMALSPDGQRLVAASVDRSLRLWDARSGAVLLRPWEAHKRGLRAVAFSPDGKSVVSAADDGLLYRWDASTGAPIGAAWAGGHSDAVLSLAFSPDGRQLVSGSRDKSLILWDVASGKPLGNPWSGHSQDVWSVAFSPDGRQVVSGSLDKTLRLWDVASGRSAPPWSGHEDAVLSVAFSPDGRLVASGSLDRSVRFWNVASGHSRSTAGPTTGGKAHEDAVTSVAFHPTGMRLVSGSRDGTLCQWDVVSGSPVGSALKGHVYRVNSVVYSPDGKLIYSAGDDRTVRIWDAGTAPENGEPWLGERARISSVAISADGLQLVSATREGQLTVWNSKTHTAVLGPWQAHAQAIRAVSFSADGQHILSAGDDQMIRRWDAQMGVQVGADWIGHQGPIQTLATSLDGKLVASGSRDGTIRLWDAASGTALGSPWREPERHAWVMALAFSTDARQLVAGGNDGLLSRWDVAQGLRIGPAWLAHADTVASVVFSPDESLVAAHRSLLVSASFDGTLRSWSWADGAAGATLEHEWLGHTGRVRSAVFSPDGRELVSASDDQSLRRWNPASGTPLGEPWLGHQGWVTDLVYSPDGNSVISGSDDGSLRLWEPRGDPVRLACRLIGANMSRKQWSDWVSRDFAYKCQCADLPIAPDEPGDALPQQRCADALGGATPVASQPR